MILTKAIQLTYDDTQQATAFINVPFMVKYLHVHQIAYINENNMGANKAKYGIITSDLTDGNQPLGIYYQDSAVPYSGVADNKYEFRNPTPINGTYTFNISQPTVSNGQDELYIIIEFQGEHQY